MDIGLLFEMVKGLHRDALRAAEAKEYGSYYVFMNKYNALYAEVCKALDLSSLPTGQLLGYKDPGNTAPIFWSGYLNGVIIETSQLVAFLETHLGVRLTVASKLVEDIDDKLRTTVRKKPESEREIQDAVENLLYIKGYEFNREKVTIPYSTKYFTPDFTFETLNTAMDVKFCNSQSDEKKTIDEINADIPAYKSKYSNAIFVVYDMGVIRDTLAFAKGIERNNPDVYVTVIKH